MSGLSVFQLVNLCSVMPGLSVFQLVKPVYLACSPTAFQLVNVYSLRCELFAKRTAYGCVYVSGGML